MTEPPKSTVSRFSHQAMGTIFEIFIAGEEEPYAGQAARAAFGEIDRLESLFSRFNPASEIGQINRLRTGESLAIGVEMFECLSIAERIRAETAGAFDVNVRMKLKFRSPDMSRIPGDTELPSFELREGTSSAGAGERCDRGDHAPSGFELRVVAAGSGTGCCLELDLGGIGKGYALDKALVILKDWSVENALVHGGTSTAIALGSAPEGEGWPVGMGGGWPSAPGEMRLGGESAERIWHGGQGRARHRREDRGTRRRAPGRLVHASVGGDRGRPLNGLHGHEDGGGRELLPQPSGCLGFRRQTVRRLPDVRSSILIDVSWPVFFRNWLKWLSITGLGH